MLVIAQDPYARRRRQMEFALPTGGSRRFRKDGGGRLRFLFQLFGFPSQPTNNTRSRIGP